MREKMLDLMKNEGLKPSQLAELLEINPAGISHILAGRNKPGFDLLQKILRRFPQINPDWLLLDNGPMYRADKTTVPPAPTIGVGAGSNSDSAAARRRDDLFQTDIFSAASDERTSPEHSGASGAPTMQQPAGSPTEGGNSRQSGSAVARIVIFYDDQTFETYAPTGR